jgi:isohexenylglutaconyl-CoA hydratase
MNTLQTLQLEQADGWLTIWLNRPESRNAMSVHMVSELMDTLQSVASDASVRGVTLRGRGGAFCAGGDIKDFKTGMQGQLQDVQAVRDSSLRAGELFERINTLPQVVLMLVEGPAMAGGMGMVCAGDVVAVCEGASFALTEVTLGIPPAQIAPYVVNRLGLRTARRLMLTAARLDATEALRLGLADFLAPDVAGLEAIEADLKRAVKRCAPGANAVTKNILLATQRLQGEELRAFAADGFAGCMVGEEGQEGVAAFLEKRKPAWAQ